MKASMQVIISRLIGEMPNWIRVNKTEYTVPLTENENKLGTSAFSESSNRHITL